MKRPPLFISGVYRSGTTLPVKILNSHPEIRITHDSVNFFRYYLKYAPTVDQDYELIIKDCASRLGKRFNIPVPTTEIIKSLEKEDNLSFATIYESLMRATFCNRRVDLIWGEKSLLQWSNIPLFLQMFKESKAIMILRDPRNVLASFRDFTIEPGARYMDAIFACLHALDWSASIGKTLDPERFRIVYFEDIINDPTAWAKEVCKFLGISFDVEMTNVVNFKDHEGKRWVPNTSFGDLSEEISNTPVSRWVDKLGKLEVCFAESILGEAMQQHNYKVSDTKMGSKDLRRLLHMIGETPLIQHRLAHWFQAGNGVESHPSDPTKPNNWSKSMLPKDEVDQ